MNNSLLYTFKEVPYSTVFYNPSFICSKIAEKIIQTNYYKNLILFNNYFKVNLSNFKFDYLLEKTLTSFNTIDFIYSKNLKLDIITAYKKKMFFKIFTLQLQKFNNKLTLLYLNNNIKLYTIFVTKKLNPINKL